MFVIDPYWLMWAGLIFVMMAIILYSSETIPMSLASLGLLCSLVLFYTIFPVLDDLGQNRLDPARILEGFANPALIAVLALLVIGQGMVNTRAFDQVAGFAAHLGGKWPMASVVGTLSCVLLMSAFLNNTPVVVIFIPIMQALADRLGRSPSSVMMPLSFAAILGGMTTLIGSSTNLLVSNMLQELGQQHFSFFSFTVPGVVLALTGLVYIIFVAPRFLPRRAAMAHSLIAESGRQFIAQITVGEDSKLIGEQAKAGMFPSLKDMTVRMILRGEHAELPSFEGLSLRQGDILIVAATRKALTDILARAVGVLSTEYSDEGTTQASDSQEQVLSEVMVTPASRLIGQTLEQIGFRYRFRAVVLGLQRRSRMIRARMTEISLEAGDVLLVQASRSSIQSLRASRDLMPMEWSQTALPDPRSARWANLIFFTVLFLMALEILPPVVAALLGVTLMLFSGVLNIRQAGRAIDRNLLLLIVAALALGTVMQETGAAAFLASAVLDIFSWAGPAGVLSVLFLLVAAFTNIISNNACAVLFTPIAVEVAQGLNADPMVFAIAVVLGANCSFITPLGYQTNLLVMGPGHYRFGDFARAGLPLTLLMCLVFAFFAPWYYGL